MNNTKSLVLSAMFTALIAVGAFIKIPLMAVPMSLQIFFVILAGLVLAPKYALLSTSLYIFIGLIGIPIFANGGGIQYVMYPTFGYLLGFVVGSYIISLLKNKTNVYIAILIGILVMYSFGIIYFVLIQYFLFGKVYTVNFILVNLFLIFLPKDIILGIIANLVYKRTKEVVNIN